MSKENRKAMYDKLVQNGLLNKMPDLSQDDGALILEFGTPTNDVSYSSMSKAELKSECDKLGLAYNVKSTNDQLIVLLENKSNEQE